MGKIQNIKQAKRLLINYIYKLSNDINEDRVSINGKIIDANKDNPVSVVSIEIEANSIITKANAIVDICKNIKELERDQIEGVDLLKERSKILEDLEVYFS